MCSNFPVVSRFINRSGVEFFMDQGVEPTWLAGSQKSAFHEGRRMEAILIVQNPADENRCVVQICGVEGFDVEFCLFPEWVKDYLKVNQQVVVLNYQVHDKGEILECVCSDTDTIVIFKPQKTGRSERHSLV